jgi:molybdenum cofactor guanylyltransferase
MAKAHQKHTALNRPAYGEFHLQEWAFIGAPCGVIQELAAKLTKATAEHYRLAYADADHAAGDEASQLAVPGSALVYTDQINYHRYDFAEAQTPFQRRPLFQDVDGVLVNGNHFSGKRQIVILDPRKADSLRRKLDRLTDVALLLTTEAQPKPYDFLLAHLGDRRPVMMPLGDSNGIIQWLRAQLTAARAPLYGLVLAGGKSQRMGADKSLLDYHGMPQHEYVARQLSGLCQQVFHSVRPGQELAGTAPVIPDTFTDLGPFGAILSAFREHPTAAWLVVACDLPLLDGAALQALIQQRNSSRLATAFHNPATGWPDPLVTIWEPRAYPVLLQFLAQGYSCPRKVLINSSVQLVTPTDPAILTNVNAPEERERVLGLLKKG